MRTFESVLSSSFISVSDAYSIAVSREIFAALPVWTTIMSAPSHSAALRLSVIYPMLFCRFSGSTLDSEMKYGA